MSQDCIKDEVIELIKKLPEDSTLEDIVYHLYVRKELEKAKKQISEGKTHSHEEVMERAKMRLEKWLK